MSRTWKLLGIAVLALSLLVVGRTRAEDEVKRSDGKPTIEDLQKDLKELRIALKRTADDIAKDISTLRPLTNLSLRVDEMEDVLIKTNKRLDNLQNQLADLDRVVRANSARVARAFEPQPLPAAGRSAIRLQNRSGILAHVILDGVDYALGPFETRTVDRPAGVFAYEVFVDTFGRILGQVTRTLGPSEVFVVQINPPQ